MPKTRSKQHRHHRHRHHKGPYDRDSHKHRVVDDDDDPAYRTIRTSAHKRVRDMVDDVFCGDIHEVSTHLQLKMVDHIYTGLEVDEVTECTRTASIAFKEIAEGTVIGLFEGDWRYTAGSKTQQYVHDQMRSAGITDPGRWEHDLGDGTKNNMNMMMTGPFSNNCMAFVDSVYGCEDQHQSWFDDNVCCIRFVPRDSDSTYLVFVTMRIIAKGEILRVWFGGRDHYRPEPPSSAATAMCKSRRSKDDTIALLRRRCLETEWALERHRHRFQRERTGYASDGTPLAAAAASKTSH